MTKATSDLMVERVFRAALSQLGSAVGCAEGPISGSKFMSCPLACVAPLLISTSGLQTMGCRTYDLVIMEDWTGYRNGTPIESN